MSMRAMTAMIMGTGIMLRETARERQFEEMQPTVSMSDGERCMIRCRSNVEQDIDGDGKGDSGTETVTSSNKAL